MRHSSIFCNMEPVRRPVASVVEPNAFRMSRPPPSREPLLSEDVDPSGAFRDSEFPADPPSWLSIKDLSSPNFSAHDFMQKALAQRFDITPRQSQLPALQDDFDADAALAALDTVETALRRIRQSSLREESAARDELRNALHFATKKRHSLLSTAETVSTNVSSHGEAGTAATNGLTEDLASLTRHSARLTELKDARDMLAMLTIETSELDAVRVSRLLARARALFNDSSLTRLLSPEDAKVADEELSRCENDLTASIFEWMRTAVDSNNNSTVVRDCAQAATNLEVDDRFIEEYINHAFTFNDVPVEISPTSTEHDVMETFQNASWEASNMLKEAVPIVLDSFQDPVKPLATLLRVLSEKKIIRAADTILDSAYAKVCTHDDPDEEQAVASSSTSNSQAAAASTGGGLLSAEQRRSLTNSEPNSFCQEKTKKNSAAQKYYLETTADLFRSLTRVMKELFDICQTPGAEDVERSFQAMPDPYQVFTEKNIPQYLDTEKRWIEDQLGVAFAEVARIEIQTPRLAPRKKSDADAYHRFRSFYGHISATFCHMTHQAIKSTWQCLSRIVSVLCSVPVSKFRNKDNKFLKDPSDASKDILTGDLGKGASSKSGCGQHESNPVELQVEDDSEDDSWKDSSNEPGSPKYTQAVLREILDNLVMNYLANAETTLQAATHLLPVCDEDAKSPELWISGASPVTAYMQTIEILSQSNEVIDEFLLNINPTDLEDNPVSPSTNAQPKVAQFVSLEAREVLHGELTSGLADLGAEAQVGVRAALDALKLRLAAMLSPERANELYTANGNGGGGSGGSLQEPESTQISDLEPTHVFMTVATFIEQQLQSVMSTASGGNRDFVVSEIAQITQEAVLDCWCYCEGPFSIPGALQLIADGKIMKTVFQNRGSAAENLDCLQAIGQLFLESPDGLWTCVETKALANVDARIVSTLLQKRGDWNSHRVVKVCQSLGASI